VISICVPVFNEAISVGPLIDTVREAMLGWRDDWELILVDDGSQDGTFDEIVAGAARESRVHPVRLARNYGQSAAMQAGFDHARGSIIITMDGDLQNDARDIPLLVARLEEGVDLVAGYRQHRQDAAFNRRFPSWVANALLRAATGIPIRDTGCTLKAFRRELLGQVRLYSDLHRFIPALAVSVAGARIAEVPVRHHARRFGRSKYGPSRVVKVLADLITLVMLRRFGESPFRMFAVVAGVVLAMSLLAATLAMVAAFGWFEAASVVVLSVIAACLLALAGFLVMAGLVAEEFVHVEEDESPFDPKLLRRVHA
jgi:glycosyltransferase involved in cell wall biosynthesis